MRFGKSKRDFLSAVSQRGNFPISYAAKRTKPGSDAVAAAVVQFNSTISRSRRRYSVPSENLKNEGGSLADAD
jgi:hypothetical protein